MKNHILPVVVATTFIWITGTSWAANTLVANAMAAPQGTFAIYDATQYDDKPDLSQFGIRPITVLYQGAFWKSGEKHENLPPRDRVRGLAKSAANSELAVVDIEHWPLAGVDDLVARSVNKYQTILMWLKTDAPALRLGYYGNIPIRDYSRAVQGPGSSAYQAWQAENTKLAILSSRVDVTFPSVYTFYKDENAWIKYAIAQIDEARRMATSKPVYVFLWPQFHKSGSTPGGDFLSATYWTTELETAIKNADGVVIWGGRDLVAKKNLKWDNNAEWWIATKQFITEHELAVITK